MSAIAIGDERALLENTRTAGRGDVEGGKEGGRAGEREGKRARHTPSASHAWPQNCCSRMWHKASGRARIVEKSLQARPGSPLPPSRLPSRPPSRPPSRRPGRRWRRGRMRQVCRSGRIRVPACGRGREGRREGGKEVCQLWEGGREGRREGGKEGGRMYLQKFRVPLQDRNEEIEANG